MAGHRSRGRLVALLAGTVAAISLVHAAPFQTASLRQDQPHTLATWLALGAAHRPGADDAAIAAIRTWSRADVLAVIRSQELNQPPRMDVPLAVRRGLLLHLDVAVLSRTEDGYRLPPGGMAFKLIGDGENVGSMQGTFHWAIGRELLPLLPPGRERSELTRDWYRATTAFLLEWGEAPEVAAQLTAARGAGVDDPELLLDECTLHQAYASPLMQQYLDAADPLTTNRPTVVSRPTAAGLSRPGSREAELEAAASCLRGVLRRDPAMTEARVRLAHVLVTTGHPHDALDELHRSDASVAVPVLRYYAALIEGRAHLALRQTDEARAAFERAVALAPRAYSPRIGLSRAALMDGNIQDATVLLTYLASVRPGESDPYWRYTGAGSRTRSASLRCCARACHGDRARRMAPPCRGSPDTTDRRAFRLLDNYICHRYICDGNMYPALTTAVLHVLLSLSGGERHGYAILKDVRAQSENRVRLGPGTIYGTLQRLMEAGWVEETPGPANSGDERRRYYRLTRRGRDALAAEVDRLDGVLRVARAHRVLPRGSRG